MKLQEFLKNTGSTTKVFADLKLNEQIEILYNGIVNNNFNRIIKIILNNKDVMLAKSYTDTSNKNFIKILNNINNTPLGKVLFAKDTLIKRNKMHICTLNKNNFDDIDVHIRDELINHYKLNEIIVRYSIFINQNNEKLFMEEYILPELTNILIE